jgi:hypothetical protein
MMRAAAGVLLLATFVGNAPKVAARLSKLFGCCFGFGIREWV